MLNTVALDIVCNIYINISSKGQHKKIELKFIQSKSMILMMRLNYSYMDRLYAQWGQCGVFMGISRGYADTDGQCQCLHDYHYDCLRAMCNTNERNRKIMKCAQCRRLIFGILDLERQIRYLSDEDEEICSICQDRLGREFELGRMRCICTARFHYRCLHQYRNQRSSYDPDQNNGMKCVTCNGIAAGIYRI